MLYFESIAPVLLAIENRHEPSASIMALVLTQAPTWRGFGLDELKRSIALPQDSQPNPRHRGCLLSDLPRPSRRGFFLGGYQDAGTGKNVPGQEPMSRS